MWSAWHPSGNINDSYGGKAKAPTRLVRSAHGHWGQWAHLLTSASHLPAGASADLELPKQWSAHQNDSPVFPDLRVGPTGLSKQFETQHDIPSKVLYFQDGWLSSFVFKVTSTRFEIKDDFSSLDVRIRPASLVEHVRNTTLPIAFQQFHRGGFKGSDDHLLDALHDITAYTSALAGGWVTSPWRKWTSLRTFSSRLVKCHGTT